LEEVLFFYLGH
jgi:hypothetical protein